MKISTAHKALNSVARHMADDALPRHVLDELLHLHLNTFEEAVAPSGRFSAILPQCRAALANLDFVEFISGVSLLRLMLPRPSYGEIAVGTRFYLGELPSVVMTKRHDGVEFNGVIYPHAREHETVILIDSSKGAH